MSPRTVSLLIRCYPRSWRERYGEELEVLLVQMGEHGHGTARAHLDIVRAGLAERVRSSSGEGKPAATRATAGAVLVLCAWAAFVVAGLAVQRFSEHWQQFAPASGHTTADLAFHVLVAAALIGSGLVALGGLCALPFVLEFMRSGGWPAIRSRVLGALLATSTAVAAGVGLVLWAHRLDSLQRNGHDSLYGLAFVAVGLLVAAALAACTAAVVGTALRIELPARLLKLEAALAAAVASTMAIMTAATATWWLALAGSAPWALTERARGAGSSGFSGPLAVALALMVVASVLAAVGALRALRAAPELIAG